MQDGGSQEYLNHIQDRRQTPPQIPDFQGAENHRQLPPSQKCPRCDSSNTKFCYYNNYSLTQPRYFCKACRWYWTHGGTLRKVPIGGSCRKSKRSKSSSSSSSNSEMGRGIQSLSPPLPSQNLISTGVISGQSLMRTSPPINIPPLGNISFYPAGGAVLPSLAVIQPFPIGVNQVTAPVSFGGGGGGGHFGGNMTTYTGNESPVFEASGFTTNTSPKPTFPITTKPDSAEPLSSWTQTSIKRGITPTSSSTSSSFWSGAATGGNSTNDHDQVCSSLNPNPWSGL